VDNWEYFAAAMFFDRELRSRPAQNADADHTRSAGGGERSKSWNSNQRLTVNLLQSFANRIVLVTRAVNIFQ
jgi:hypothetical protein